MFILSTCLFVNDQSDAVFLDIHFLTFFDEGIRTDDGIGYFCVAVNEGAVHDDGVCDLRAFFDDDVAGDDAMVDLAKDDGTLVDEGIFDFGGLADELRGAVDIFAKNLILTLDGIDVDLWVSGKEKVHVRLMEGGDGSDVFPVSAIGIGDEFPLILKHRWDDVLAEVVVTVF